MSWIDVSPAVKYCEGDRSPENEKATCEVIRSVAWMVVSKHAGRCSAEDAEDAVSEAVITVFRMLDRPYVDFSSHSAFNFLFTQARHAITNSLRKPSRFYELRMSDMSETFESCVSASAAAPGSAESVGDTDAVRRLGAAYRKVAARAAALGRELAPFEDAVEDGCDFSERSFTRDALLVSMMRALAPCGWRVD